MMDDDDEFEDDEDDDESGAFEDVNSSDKIFFYSADPNILPPLPGLGRRC